MKQVKKTSLLVFCLSFLILACSQKKKVEIETLAKVYVDLLVAEDYYKDTDSLDRKRDEVFKKYSVTEDIYDSTYKQFSYNKEEWDKFFDLANAYLDTLKSHLKKPSLQKE